MGRVRVGCGSGQLRSVLFDSGLWIAEDLQRHHNN